MTMHHPLRRFAASLLAGLLGAAAPAMAADTASFEPATSTLRLPTLQLDAGDRYRDVVVRLLDPGQLRVDDPGVGAELQYLTTGSVLHLPQVLIGTATYPRVSLTRPGLELLSVGGLLPPPSAADASVPGAISTPFPTLENISVEWAFTGDANRNAVVSVRYRAQGSSTWLAGMPLRRIHNETSGQGRTWPLRHSGSLFDLAPGTSYEIELTLTDPDGGSTVRTTTATTRSLPMPAPGALVRPATPATLASVLAAANAGDIVELGAGRYSGFSVGRSGAPGRPLVIRGTPGAVVEGEISVFNQRHVMLTELALNGRVRFNGTNDFSMTRSTVNATAALGGHGIITFTRAENAYIADNTVTGTVVWSEAALGVSGGNAGEGILVTGPGHVIAHNRVARFRDNISLLEDGEAVDQYSIDILNNEISEAADDGVEADFCMHNCRILRNRLTNVFIALSSQPGLGGPTYFVRNVVYNAVHVAFKLYRSSYGDVLLHNTVVKNGDALGIYAGATVGRLYARNNLFIGGPGGTYGGYSSGTGRVLSIADLDVTSADLDYDAYGSTAGSFTGRWGTTSFDSLAELRARTTERAAVQVGMDSFAAAPVFPGAPLTLYNVPDLRLQPGSPAVDAGQRIPNINQGHQGSAPDAGAYEQGQALPVYGPR